MNSQEARDKQKLLFSDYEEFSIGKFIHELIRSLEKSEKEIEALNEHLSFEEDLRIGIVK